MKKGNGLTTALLLMGIILAVTACSADTGSGNDNFIAGVHVCTSSHYDNHNVLCTHDDGTITLDKFNTAYLAYGTSDSGTNFNSPNMRYLIQQYNPSDGTSTSLGEWDQGGQSLAVNLEALHLSYVFNQAGVVTTNGMTYQIEVDNGNTNLGTTTFTYKE